MHLFWYLRWKSRIGLDHGCQRSLISMVSRLFTTNWKSKRVVRVTHSGRVEDEPLITFEIGAAIGASCTATLNGENYIISSNKYVAGDQVNRILFWKRNQSLDTKNWKLWSQKNEKLPFTLSDPRCNSFSFGILFGILW